MMQQLLQDVFSDTIAKAKQIGMWEKLTPLQKELLVSKYLREYFERKRSIARAEAASRY